MLQTSVLYKSLFLSLGMGFLFKLLVQLIYNTEIHDPYQQFVWDTYLFILPLVAGLVIQFIFPHSVKFFMKILLYLSLIVIPYTIFTHMNYYLDLYVYGLFTWKVRAFEYMIFIIILNSSPKISVHRSWFHHNISIIWYRLDGDFCS